MSSDPKTVEALRQAVNSLPRYSFLLDAKGNVVKAPGGKWLDWNEVHALFDCEPADWWVAQVDAQEALKKAAK